MEADLLHQRLSQAIEGKRPITLLLRGAHRLVIDSASISSSKGGGQTRFDIAGNIGIGGDPGQPGTVSVTSDDVASVFVKDPVNPPALA